MSYRKKKRTPANPKQTVLAGMNADLQGVEELLSTGELYSGQPYQRPVKDCDVDKLVREWDPRLLTPLVVSYREGRNNLVDGQHRVCAMRKKNGGTYPLRDKVFCGCCRHAMPRTANKNHYFLCRHSKVDQSAPCHGMTVMEAELEKALYEILTKQAQVILNMADLSNAGMLDIRLAEQAEYDKQINRCLDQKRALYEQFILKQITIEGYKSEKAAVDSELDRLREIRSNLRAQTSQMEMDEKAKRARAELAREVAGADGLTAGLANTLIDRVYVYPNNQVKIIWKIRGFGMGQNF